MRNHAIGAQYRLLLWPGSALHLWQRIMRRRLAHLHVELVPVFLVAHPTRDAAHSKARRHAGTVQAVL